MKITRVTGTPDQPVKRTDSFVQAEFQADRTIVQSSSARLTFGEDGQEPVLVQKGWELKPVKIFRYVTDENGLVEKKRTADGERTVAEHAEKICTGTAYRGKIRFETRGEARILGLGQHENGIRDYRNCTQYLYQNNMQIPMPVFLSAAGYGVVIDAQCLMIYREADHQITIDLDAAEQIDYYVIEADSLKEIVQGIRRMTGKAGLLPLWAYGYIQSKERYKSQRELAETAEEFAKREIPVSCLVQDWMTWEGEKWGDKHLDASRYPDLKAVTELLHSQGAALLFSVWPNMNQGSEDNREMLEAGKLYANLSTYDAFDAEARSIYWKQCEREIFAGGADGWWCDSTEPFTPDWEGSVKKSEKARYELARESLTGYMDARRANAYALYHARGIYENQRKADPSGRVVNLTRSGYPGIQKYGTILWSGDIAADWEVLRRQITEGLQMAASGIPYWTLDIGGFFAGNLECWKRWSGAEKGPQPWFWSGVYERGTEDPGYRELYVRWLQYGTFLPVMRSHGTDTPREPWNFGEQGSIYYDTIVKYIHLRYHLVPYIYSLAWDVYRNDAMMMRGMLFDYPGQREAEEAADQYLFGDFLVCPVTEPMEYGPNGMRLTKEQKRSVWLPDGLWYDYESKECLEGGAVIWAAAPIDKMPLYLHAGSIVPICSENRPDLWHRQKIKTLELEIYGGKDGSFTVYLDAGNGYEYENGVYFAARLEWEDGTRRLTVAETEGSWEPPVFLEARLYTPQGVTERKTSYRGNGTQLQF